MDFDMCDFELHAIGMKIGIQSVNEIFKNGGSNVSFVFLIIDV